MNPNEYSSSGERTSFIWRRIAVVLILALPFLFAAGGFVLLPGAAAEHVEAWIQPLSSILTGFVSATFWQCIVLFGWFILVCLYLYAVDLSLQRGSILLASGSIIIAVLFASFLLYQQQLISVATADAYVD